MNRRQNQCVVLLVLLSLVGVRASGEEMHPSPGSESEGKTYLLIARRPTIGSPSQQQKIGMAAVRRIANAAGTSGGAIVVDKGADSIVPHQQHAAAVSETEAINVLFKQRLERLTRIATPQDTVIIYTHSHGLKSREKGGEFLGGLALDQPGTGNSPRGVLPWDEYAELIVDIPAKNVVVMTMSCFSGELVDTLNSPRLKSRWESRREKEGRSLIVLTAQNALLTSGPILKESEIINPFTFAVSRMFACAADGFRVTNGIPDENRKRDGKLTFGEMIDYVLHTTENVASEHPRFRNTAKPQLTGCYERRDVLGFGTGEDTVDKQDLNREDRSRAIARDGNSQYVVATAFLTNDADGDGRISRKEAEPVVAKAYDKFDQNSDGFIDQDEFKAVALRFIKPSDNQRRVQSMPVPPSRFISQLFSRNDADGNGQITRKEAKPVVANHYDEFDQNSDGVVDQNEFKTVAPQFIRASGNVGTAP